MRTERLRGALEQLCLAGGGLTDGQLLGRFLDGREEAAFAAIVRRHGPMVLGVCRRLLGNVHDAEDAFQATFLILARKAASVARREALGAFLYGVAYRTALGAREKAARRRAVERQVEEMPHPKVPPAEPQDWRPILDRELNLLPERFRSVLLLCDLEGKTRREAARQLGVPEGTIASRLATARRTLARRLARCGVVLSGGALAVALAGGAAAAVPAPLAAATVKAAALVAAGQAAAAGTPAVALMNEVLRAMLMTKLKAYAGVVLVAALVGVGGLAYRAAGQQARAPGTGAGPVPGQAAPAEGHPLTELELLRREVDILKAQVDLLQERQRAQEAELRALKGRAGGREPAPAGGTGPRTPVHRGSALDGQTNPFGAMPGGGPPGGYGGGFPGGYGGGFPGGFRPGGTQEAPAHVEKRTDAPSIAGRQADVVAATKTGNPGAGPAGASPEEDMEAALHALREARDDAARQRAVDAMEKALQRLRQERRPSANRTPGP
jgi:RNA polymerase sigma factor (sigma-70 family)